MCFIQIHRNFDVREVELVHFEAQLENLALRNSSTDIKVLKLRLPWRHLGRIYLLFDLAPLWRLVQWKARVSYAQLDVCYATARANLTVLAYYGKFVVNILCFRVIVKRFEVFIQILKTEFAVLTIKFNEEKLSLYTAQWVRICCKTPAWILYKCLERDRKQWLRENIFNNESIESCRRVNGVWVVARVYNFDLKRPIIGSS